MIPNTSDHEAMDTSGLKHYALWAYLDHELKDASKEQMIPIKAKIFAAIHEELDE